MRINEVECKITLTDNVANYVTAELFIVIVVIVIREWRWGTRYKGWNVHFLK